MRGELETGTDCYILTQSSSNHSSTSFASWLGCSTMGHWGPKPSVWSWFSLHWHPISHSNWNWPKLSVAPGYIIVSCPPASCGRTHLPPSPNSTTSTGQGDIPISSTGCTCFAVLPLIYTGASLDWWLGQRSICNTSTSIIIGISLTLMFYRFFSTQARFKYLSIFCFLLFSLSGSLEQQNPQDGKFFFSPPPNYHLLRSSSWD